MMLETILTDEAERLRKSNSLFVPKGFPVKAGVVIPVVMRNDDYEKELRLQKGKQGAAIVTSVRFVGTLGERPLAQITVERAGGSYHIHQSIEPLYGVEIGDELWIALSGPLGQMVGDLLDVLANGGHACWLKGLHIISKSRLLVRGLRMLYECPWIGD
ncbi:hypothetical protein M5X00_07130 [Paenibacillus alvei]|uniref:Uncharacterized protein n=1 Tax=Paenibacillus alvei TaxID=44250 RepID=A0ABT4GZZ6_PAEAL|nr:hypothetical protein [Paenibacillus alvei]MCY9544482.1 hypothetical protein [Paenibacillus alvei]MCY9702847.1 hypothetical protein [Paenibacillus alvei]MCY9733161.1 hypothetical protein [Paenibacillus alvei]MCY9754027.1 hypothetical protein [Paenibacillus alvei]MCY9762245.1 hypothetical protein [Paenibacillus alvei]